jgi:hypothetical protein
MPSLRLFTRLLPLGMVAVLLSACAVATVERSPREWTTSVEGVDGRTHVIRVRDTSGRVDDATVDPTGVPVPEGVVLAPGTDRTLLVPWVGGSCDATTAIDVAPGGGGVVITITPTSGAEVCDAMAVGHVVALTFGEPIGPGDVTLRP